MTININMTDYLNTLGDKCPKSFRYEKNELAKWMVKNLTYKHIDDIAHHGAERMTNDACEIEAAILNLYYDNKEAITEISSMYEDSQGHPIICTLDGIDSWEDYIYCLTCAAMEEIAQDTIYRINEIKQKEGA